MARYGDSIVCICPTQGLLGMPTAVIIHYTADGFLLVADGLSRCEVNGVFKPHRDDEQKIFPIIGEQSKFAFAVAGTARFTPDGISDDVVFDFYSQVSRLAANLDRRKLRDGIEYCDSLSASVRKSLKHSTDAARRAGKKVTYPTKPDQFGGGTIAFLFLGGFYAGVPHSSIFRFFHRNQELALPQKIATLVEGESRVHGSQKVGNLLKSNDPRFAQFRVPLPAKPSFRQLAHAEKNYIDACASEAGRAEDPENCLGIGGRVLAATVTAKDRFRWIPGFAPKGEASPENALT